MLSTLLFGSALATTLASSKIRFGEEGTSLEDDGRLKQPFYYDTSSETWRKLTYGRYGLDFVMYTGGSSDSSWNTEGEALDLSGAPDAVDSSGLTDGVGTLKVSHTVSVGDVSLQISREYTIATADAATATMLVKVPRLQWLPLPEYPPFQLLKMEHFWNENFNLLTPILAPVNLRHCVITIYFEICTRRYCAIHFQYSMIFL